MNYILVIHAAAARAQAPRSALRFARAALTRGHAIRQVFCHGEGVYNLLAPEAEAGADDVVGAWRDLARERGFPILACVSAAERRGLSTTAGQGMAAPGSLGQLMTALDEPTRVIEFG